MFCVEARGVYFVIHASVGLSAANQCVWQVYAVSFELEVKIHLEKKKEFIKVEI